MATISEKQNVARHSQRVYLFCLIVGTFYLLEISLISSICVSGAVSLLVLFGKLLLRYTGLGEVGIGVGFIVGAGFLVFAAQVPIWFDVSSRLTHLAILAGMFTIIVWDALRSRDCAIRRNGSIAWEARFVFQIGLLVFASRHSWMIFFVTPAIVAGELQHVSWRSWYGKLLRLISISLLPVGTWWATQYRPKHWWYLYQSNDIGLFEAIGWSSSQWGIFEHPGLIGNSIANYHWLAYTTSGAMSQVALLGPWDWLAKLGPLLLGVLFASISTDTINTVPTKAFSSRWVLILLVVIAMPTTRFDSFSYSILIALALYIVLPKIESEMRGWFKLPLLTFFSLLLLFSKVTTALVILVYLMLVALVQRLRRTSVSWVAPLVLSIACAVTWMKLFRFNPSGESVTSLTFRFWDSVAETVSVASQPAVAATTLLLTIVLALGILRFARLSAADAALLYVTAVGIGFRILQAGVESWYLMMPQIYILLFVLLSKLFHTNLAMDLPTVRSSRGRSLAVVTFGFCLGNIYQEYFPMVSAPRVFIWLVGGGFAWKIFATNGYVYLSALSLFLTAKCWPKVRLTASLIVIALVLGISLGISADSFRRTPKDADNYTIWGGNSAPFATPDLVKVATFVREQTPTEIVLASNNFCCFGATWLDKALAGSQNLTSRTESWFGGMNYLLPAETRRRFLAQGRRFRIDSKDLTPDEIRRLEASLTFANDPTPKSAETLRLYGVDGYIVNLSLSAHRDWSNFAVEKFRSGNFMYMELISSDLDPVG